MKPSGILATLALLIGPSAPAAAQEPDPEVPSAPAELALRELQTLREQPIQDPARRLRLELHLIYHVAAEHEPWVDSLQAIVDDPETAEALDPAIVQAYLGGTEVLRAKHGTWPPSRLKWVRRGVANLDGARSLAPDDLDVVYLQTASTLFLPFFMARGEEAEADLADLANALLSGPGDLDPSVHERMVGFVTDHSDRLDPAVRGRVHSEWGVPAADQSDGRR
jgi:hypothetical protein